MCVQRTRWMCAYDYKKQKRVRMYGQHDIM